MRTVRFYFDFVSPYSWLAMAQAEAFGRDHAVGWELRPFLFGAILDRLNILATGEDPRKRAHGYRDIQRVAHRLGLTFHGPPEHPFVSLAALRLQVAAQQAAPDRALKLAVTLFALAWERGADLNDRDVLAGALREVGIEDDVAELARSQPVKDSLRENGEAAWADGVFGLPSLVVAADGELFYGQDRLLDLAQHLDGTGPEYVPFAEIAKQRRGAQRLLDARQELGS